MVDTNETSARLELNEVELVYPLSHFHRDVVSQFGGLIGGKNLTRLPRHVRALDGINLSIKDGERVGVVGRNGAGKSTLLRVLSGVYPPTVGSREALGTVQGLYDIGVGFEQHRTGRENILYRGLIMGRPPAEIREREEEIIEFSGLGDRIDTPIETYSTGMVVRLAFSISSFLQGDILVVDEIFAAGDAKFQEKASARMTQIMEEAKILVFCSHNLAQVSELCTRGLWVEGGKIAFDGPVDDAIDAYIDCINGG